MANTKDKNQKVNKNTKDQESTNKNKKNNNDNGKEKTASKIGGFDAL